MKRYLIVLICVFICIANAFAQEGTAIRPVPPPPAVLPPQGYPAVPPEPVLPPPADIPPPPAPPANLQQGLPLQAPLNVPVNLPPNVTPEQVKAFLGKPKEENYIILNFDNADLKDVINTVGSITKENFIISPGVDARITIHSQRKIPVSEVMNVFESVLEVNGITLVKSGDFFKVVPGATAKQKPIEIRKGNQAGDVPEVDRLITQLVSVNYVPVSEITSVLTPLLSQFGGIIPNIRNNLLIINDLSSNIKRLLTILEEIDVNAFQNTRMLFFKPQYSDIVTLTDELTEVLNALNITKDGIALVPIERINSLVVFASSTHLLEAVEGWIKKLDAEVITGQNVFIYPVQNVKAENIAEILNSLYGEGGAVRKISKQLDAAKRLPQGGQAPPQVQHAPGQKDTSSRVEIITFEPTNSLIILAPSGLYRDMVETIKKIDIYPREVLIEAVVAQVTLSDTDKFGIQWSVLQDIHYNGQDIKSIIQNTSSAAPALIKAAPLLASAPAGGLSFFMYKPDNMTALVTALTTKGKVNILSSPRLLVRDQEEASIEVGSEIPTATSTTSTTTTDTLTQSIQYKTVGIKLKIKPTISEEKTVVLDLEQEVSSQGDNVAVGAGGSTYPSFNTTKTKTSIVIPDREGIIIGGIMEESKEKGYQGIPFLSTIPIIGNLFRYTADTVKKKELVILITPYVIVNKSEGEKLTGEFMSKLKEVKKYLDEKDINVGNSSDAVKTTPANN